MSDEKRFAPVESYSAAEKVAGNYDLLHDILSRLPVKALNRCKPVSRQWGSLISDMELVRLNPSQNLVLAGFFFYNSLTHSQSVESLSIYHQHNLPSLQFLDHVIEGASVKIVQSVNGLLLCSLTRDASKRYCLCNPKTSFYKLLPQPDQSSVLGYHLLFDPSISPHYKLIRVVECELRGWWIFQSNDRRKGWRIEMYSSELNSWRQCVDIPHVPWGTNFDNGVFWNGGIHWDTYPCTFLSFDVESERMMKLPSAPINPTDQKGGCSYLGESNGCLYCIKVPDICSQGFYINELRKGDQEWTCRWCVMMSSFEREFRGIRQQTRQRGYNESVYAYSILHVGGSYGAERGEEEEGGGQSMLMIIPGKVISYNFASKRVKVLKDLPGDVIEPFVYSSFSAFAFMESL